jgi:putative hydrolase of the HAD superfamily
MIRTVFFDVGNTLLLPAIPESEVLVEAAAGLGVILDPTVVAQNIPHMYKRYEELYEADNSLWASEERAVGIWLAIYEHLCELVGVPELGPSLARVAYEKFLEPDSWALFDDVIPTLFALQSRGVQLGLISNWDSSLEGIVKGMGIRFYFDIIIASAAVGMHKPQSEIFELALSQAGVLPDEAMHIGDHLQADVGGASAVGITPVLIDRDGRHEDGEGYIRIQNLRDVIKYL